MEGDKVITVSDTYIREALELKDGVIFWRKDRPRTHFREGRLYTRFISMFGGKEVDSRQVRLDGERVSLVKVKEVLSQPTAVQKEEPQLFVVTKLTKEGKRVIVALYEGEEEAMEYCDILARVDEDTGEVL